MKSKDLRLLLSLSGGRRFLLTSICAAATTTAITITQAFLIAHIIVGIIKDDSGVNHYIISLCCLWIFKSIFISQFERWALFQAIGMKRELRNSITRNSHLLLTHSPTEISTLLIKGANALDIYIGRLIPQVISASLTPIAVISVIAINDILSAVIAIITLPLIPIFGALIGKYTEDSVSAKWKSLGVLGKYFEDSLRGLSTLSIFGRSEKQHERIAEMGNTYTRQTMKVLRISFLSALVLELCGTISVALIAVSIGLRLVNGSMEFLPALAILILAPEVYFPLRNAASLFHASADGVEALSRLQNAEKEISPIVWGSQPLADIQVISWPEFRHPFSESSPIFPATEVAAGELVVIKGASGSGKSTLLKNILGVRNDISITVNKQDIFSLKKESYYKKVAWIPQHPNFLGSTIRQEFQLIEPNISDPQIEELLHKAHLKLAELPRGLDTLLGSADERAGHVSGGQIRRIAFARAMARKPSFIIADEPTADLDEETSQLMYSVIAELVELGTAVIVITHDDHEALTPHHVIEAVTL